MTTPRFGLFVPVENIIDPVTPKLAAPVPDGPAQIVKASYVPYFNPYESSGVKKELAQSPQYVEILGAEQKQESTVAVEDLSKIQESTSTIVPSSELKPTPAEPVSLRASLREFSRLQIAIVPEFYDSEEARHAISPRHKLLLQTLHHFATMGSKKFKKDRNVLQLKDDLHNILEYKDNLNRCSSYSLEKLELELKNEDDFLLDQLQVLEDFYYAENVSDDNNTKIESAQEATLCDELFKEVVADLVVEARLDLERPIKQYLAMTVAALKQSKSLSKDFGTIVQETKEHFRISITSEYQGLTPEEEKLCNAAFYEVAVPGLFKNRIEVEIKNYIALRLKQERLVGAVRPQSFAERVAETKKHFYSSEFLLRDPSEFKQEQERVTEESSVSNNSRCPAPLAPKVYTAGFALLIASVNAGSGENNENLDVTEPDNQRSMRLGY